MSHGIPNDLRIGCVPYLNARPLIYGIEDRAAYDVPSLLADRFAAEEFDVALIPIYETFQLPEAYVVDGLSISCFGDVDSVILAHKGPLEKIPEIIMDPSSRTSANLLRVLLRNRFHIAPRLVPVSGHPEAARLIIGDPALEFQARHEADWQILDLGGAWLEWTGLPFVFAVWTVRPGVHPLTAGWLRKIAAHGIDNLEAIARRESNPEAAYHYLSRHIQYGLGDQEKASIARFRELLMGSLLLSRSAPALRFL